MTPEPVRRSGFTVLEVVVSVTLTAAVFAITLPYLVAQAKGIGESAARIDAEQTARFAVASIDRDLRRASADTDQPVLVHLGPRAISFNANLVSSQADDPLALESDPELATSTTLAWDVAQAAILPGTTRQYPPRTYLGPDGQTSGRETISYFLLPDTISGRTDLFVLWRQVNHLAPVVVVRSLLLPAGVPFFRYFRPVATGTATPPPRVPTEVPAASLPLFWDSPLIDSVNVVEVRAIGRYLERRTGREQTSIQRSATMIGNAVSRRATCGTAPSPPANVSAVQRVETTGNGNNASSKSFFQYTVSWSRSTQDGADNTGQNDVRTYVVERAPTAAGPWAAVASVSARTQNQYMWIDALEYSAGAVYVPQVYRVIAVDCGGNRSTPAGP